MGALMKLDLVGDVKIAKIFNVKIEILAH